MLIYFSHLDSERPLLCLYTLQLKGKGETSYEVCILRLKALPHVPVNHSSAAATYGCKQSFLMKNFNRPNRGTNICYSAKEPSVLQLLPPSPKIWAAERKNEQDFDMLISGVIKI